MNEQLQSGSDSFLDIIANLVGILVILVVATALRVSNTPSSESPEPTQAPAAAADPAALVPIEVPLAWDPLPRDRPIDVYLAGDPAPPPLRLPEPQANVDLIAAVRRLEETPTIKPVRTAELQARLRLLEQIDASDPDGREVAELTGQVGEAEAAIADLKSQLEAARVRLSTVQLSEDTPESLVHEIRPVARAVSLAETELYLYLRNDRLAVVPQQELIRQVGKSVSRRGPRGFAGGIMRGEVGPVGDFRAKYVLRRGGSSAMDDLLQTARSVQSTLFIETDTEQFGDPIDVALDRRSPLRRVVESRRIVLTVAVYPDSFGAARKLQAYARDAGVRIALRPQPAELPLTFSSNGSGSMAQ